MKFQCDQKLLQEVLLVVSMAVSPKSTLPCLEGILLRCDATTQTLTLTGYNLDLGITHSIPVSQATSGAVVLPATLLSNMISKLRGGMVTFEVDERSQTIVSNGGATFTVLGLPADDFPELPTISQSQQFSLEAEMLAGMISKTLFAVAVTDQNPVYMGSLCTLSDGIFSMVSVDGYRLAIRKEPVSLTENAPLDLSFIVPGKTLGELQKLLHKWSAAQEEPPLRVAISLSAKHIVFSCMGYEIISRLIEGTFLDYQKTIPDQATTTLTLSAREFLDALGRVSIVINERAKSPVVCRIEAGQVLLSCETPMGQAQDACVASCLGDPLTISFNHRYLQDAIKAAGCDQVTAQLSGPFSPIKIVPPDPTDDSFLFLVLPVRA